MALPLTIGERLAVVESRTTRHATAIGLAQDGLALLSEDGRALRAEVAEFRQEMTEFRTEVTGRLDDLTGRLDGVTGRLDGVTGRLDGVTGRLDRQGAVLTAIAAHLGIDVPPAT